MKDISEHIEDFSQCECPFCGNTILEFEDDELEIVVCNGFVLLAHADCVADLN